MKIISLKNSEFDENTYIIFLKNKTILVDPAADFHSIKSVIRNKKLTLILLTHGHFDHIASLEYFDKKLIYAHIKEKELLEKPEQNLSAFFMKPLKIEGINFLNGKIVDFDNNIKIYHTPGHTQGSIIIKIEKNIFTGDTLFLDTVGRTDLPTGNKSKLNESLRIFSEFNKNSIVYPGHGKSFVLENAFKINDFLV